jgi:hypothetical protein
MPKCTMRNDDVQNEAGQGRGGEMEGPSAMPSAREGAQRSIKLSHFDRLSKCLACCTLYFQPVAEERCRFCCPRLRFVSTLLFTCFPLASSWPKTWHDCPANCGCVRSTRGAKVQCYCRHAACTHHNHQATLQCALSIKHLPPLQETCSH